MKTIQCRSCHIERRVSSTASQLKQCVRCNLVMNKLLLHKCYDAVTTQSDMLEFDRDMEKWYTTS